MTFYKRLFKNRSILTISMLIGALAALLLATFASFAEFAAQCESVKREVLRLHILPNSDNYEDQRLKYMLRDFLIEDVETLFADAETLDDAKRIAAQNLTKIEKSASEFIKAQGFDYEVEVSLVNMYFTTRNYENITMPAGNYDALRVTIGAGDGQNWWCVAFPPLCLPAASAKNGEPYFSAEASKIIENGGGKVEAKFKVYEWWTGFFG
ncbi:MAG: stage II sporulation protein R [Oscillospiraceae bacterium]|nr:stage II sporulation protein R [Oscillospiraceae bacterium]